MKKFHFEWKNFDWKSIGMDKWLLLALAGVLLIMGMPAAQRTQPKEKTVTVRETDKESLSGAEYAEYMEQKLEHLIGQMGGIGKVKVMITLKSTGQKVVLMEKPYTKNVTTEEDAQGGRRSVEELSEDQRVIYLTDKNGNNVPYVVQEREPEIEGIAIAAEGGGDSKKAAEITRITEALFSVSSHKISVIEMNE